MRGVQYRYGVIAYWSISDMNGRAFILRRSALLFVLRINTRTRLSADVHWERALHRYLDTPLIIDIVPWYSLLYLIANMHLHASV